MNLLEEARKEINEVDAEMAKLFEKRMRAAEKVAAYKKENSLPILDKEREAQILKKSALRIEDEVLQAYYLQFMESNMKISRAYQSRLLMGMTVAFCGTEGAFSHIATCKLFPYARKLAYKSFEKAYRAVESGECDACILPIENSSNGEVGEVSDLLFSGSLYVNASIELAVSHDLLIHPSTSIKNIKTVISHPQALGQCADYIAKKGFETREFPNTALAAKWVQENADPTVAAIASSEAAEIFGLTVAQKNINQTRNNTTKFFALSRVRHGHTADERGLHSILTFTVRNEAGALARAIDIIGQHGFNMQTLRSRPMKELLWQYYFLVESEGDMASQEGEAMLRALSPYCDHLKVIGTYRKIETT